MTALFSHAMALREVDPGVFAGELNKHWTIGPKVHGGAMLALCANAARTAHGGPSPGDDAGLPTARGGRAIELAAGGGLGQLPVGARPRSDAAGDVDPQARAADQRRRR
jgi:hypothetical protein